MFIRRRKCGAIRMKLCLSLPLYASPPFLSPRPTLATSIPAWSLGPEHPLTGLEVGGRKETQDIFEPWLLPWCLTASSLHHCLGGFWPQNQGQGSRRAEQNILCPGKTLFQDHQVTTKHIFIISMHPGTVLPWGSVTPGMLESDLDVVTLLWVSLYGCNTCQVFRTTD